jgi:hypothetical protein
MSDHQDEPSTYKVTDRRAAVAPPKEVAPSPAPPVALPSRAPRRLGHRRQPWLVATVGVGVTLALVASNILTAAFFAGAEAVLVWFLWLVKVTAEHRNAEALALGEWTWSRGFKRGSKSEAEYWDRRRREAPPVQVKTYKNAREYESDAPTMIRLGYGIGGQMGAKGHINPLRTVGKAAVFVPWALLRPSRQGDKFVVTWVKQG